MDTRYADKRSQSAKSFLGLAFCLMLLGGAVFLASSIQTDFGRVEVSNVTYPNFNEIPMRAKLFVPVGVSRSNPAPGAVYIHGYQNNRETGDAYSIELARRGFVVLNIDAIGRGNSGEPGDPSLPGFDPTYGGKTSVQYLRRLPFVRPDSVGILGHSLGAEMAYTVALEDPTIQALVITGFAYTLKSSAARPKNMLMIIGKWDEFRQRMTGTRDIEKEWMQTEQTKRVFPAPSPKIGATYGDFTQGTARRVFVPPITHVQESHDSASIAETVEWMRAALRPNPRYWVDKNSQSWWIKEYATLAAMLAGLASILPLGLILLRTNFFGIIRHSARRRYSCSLGGYFKFSAINGLLLWLYLPMILVLFGVHKYALPIDRYFPMMMVNGIVWWFLWVNVIGGILFWRWYRREQLQIGLTAADLGITLAGDRHTAGGAQLLKTVLLAGILFAFAYGSEYLLERIFLVDYRFVWPFASDLTPYRWRMFFLYYPFLLICFILGGMFLHGQIRRPEKTSAGRTFLSWSAYNVFALTAPLILFLMVQYIPLFTNGFIPFEGPGGLFVVFMISLFHTLALLAITTVISTWFYVFTGHIYLGAFLNAALVAWMFASSQVIAPIPV
jgi:hypothetical protein